MILKKIAKKFRVNVTWKLKAIANLAFLEESRDEPVLVYLTKSFIDDFIL